MNSVFSTMVFASLGFLFHSCGPEEIVIDPGDTVGAWSSADDQFNLNVDSMGDYELVQSNNQGGTTTYTGVVEDRGGQLYMLWVDSSVVEGPAWFDLLQFFQCELFGAHTGDAGLVCESDDRSVSFTVAQ